MWLDSMRKIWNLGLLSFLLLVLSNVNLGQLARQVLDPKINILKKRKHLFAGDNERFSTDNLPTFLFQCFSFSLLPPSASGQYLPKMGIVYQIPKSCKFFVLWTCVGCAAGDVGGETLLLGFLTAGESTISKDLPAWSKIKYHGWYLIIERLSHFV